MSQLSEGEFPLESAFPVVMASPDMRVEATPSVRALGANHGRNRGSGNFKQTSEVLRIVCNAAAPRFSYP